MSTLLSTFYLAGCWDAKQTNKQNEFHTSETTSNWTRIHYNVISFQNNVLLLWGATQKGSPTLICWTNPHILRKEKEYHHFFAARSTVVTSRHLFLSRLRDVKKTSVKKVVATAPKALYQTYAYMKNTLTGYVSTSVSSHLRENTYTNKRQKYLRWTFIRSEITRENFVSALTLPKYPRLAHYWSKFIPNPPPTLWTSC